ncbi:MAG: hypothetical protein KDL87_12180, partial [Verrucomicrobiae bacterium]|nr:hypothetical protein [Verrucomicrobiae bacterium]
LLLQKTPVISVPESFQCRILGQKLVKKSFLGHTHWCFIFGSFQLVRGMARTPHAFPPGESIISDDVAAAEIMGSLGVLGNFLKEPLPGTTSVSGVYEHHPTHWVLCARFLGNPDPAENGLMIRAFPKSSVPLAGVLDVHRRLLGNSVTSVGLIFPED